MSFSNEVIAEIALLIRSFVSGLPLIYVPSFFVSYCVSLVGNRMPPVSKR